MPVSRPTDQIEDWIEAELLARDEGEDIEFELMLAPHPQMGMIGMLYVAIPSFTLGEKVAGNTMIPVAGATGELVEATVHEMLMQLRSQRTELAKEQINGSGLPPIPGGGLTLPPSLG